MAVDVTGKLSTMTIQVLGKGRVGVSIARTVRIELLVMAGVRIEEWACPRWIPSEKNKHDS